MIWLLLALPVAALALACLRAPLALWTLAVAAWLGGIAWLGAWPVPIAAVVMLAYLGVAALLIVKPMRRALISRPLLDAYRRILPPMSQTEREALEAGTVWWEGDLFRGRPDWNKLLAAAEARGRGTVVS